jgi:glycopeptide antibiotics resistance protein
MSDTVSDTASGTISDTARQRRLSLVLSVLYLAAVTAVILFKFPFRGDGLGSTRVVELVPFYVTEIQDQSFFINNLVYNFLFFIPLGIYICLLKPGWPFIKKAVPIASLSLLYELLQFILGIGISDITDLITNTAGGLFGIGLYHVALMVHKDRTHKVINIIALGLTLIMVMIFIVARRLLASGRLMLF